ncbi:LacI family transcriptional regulator [Mangrovactinospora gilvigrisea]|uniref:LacI family transcriptional regulator n=1 Tax=Mangrovactinospora gilvigrisea TaxID=1428644 RepID=A0A1J7BSX7_9ACTN|nr:LacI family DNA-binding transcriptional regulator [Mangrovactinospora gilvigrisea]OIV36569.1 LacI family transcriptional regulator [Mangrovactinospora gilvigrisea]
MSPARRTTIDDIARAAGVSKATASAALNGRSGVAAATRARVLNAAESAGWQPSSAARALSGTRTDTLGLLLDRPARTLGAEPFYMQLISGIEAALADRGTGLLLQVVEGEDAEQRTLRAWWAARRVDGVFLCDLREDDSRIALVESLDLPAVVVGGPEGTGGVTAAWSDNTAPVRECLDYLYSLGHRRIAYVAGLPELAHTATRVAEFRRRSAELGLDGLEGDAAEGPAVLHADYSGEEGARATRALLIRRAAPTAIVYDNDVMAVAGAAVTQEMRVPVPGRVSLVAWDDSTLCGLVHPPLTALGRDVAAYGGLAARLLLDRVDGADVGDVEAAPMRLIVRGSTGPAPE